MTTLYLKYRPQKISELDLTDVREFLSKIVKTGNIPHAFLFEGPRGSGKTSAARIIAKVLNCTDLSKDYEPCNVCEQCISITKGTNIDVIELDAASHRGIDDVRLIRESVKLAPAKAFKKVYIIDEAHMLTTEASNALLKTLEEPPEHVVFILATTNPEKLLDTIKSRTVRVSFKKASSAEIIKSLSKVLEAEKIKYQKEVLELVSKNVDGSFRDAKKILEEMLIDGDVDNLEKAQNFLLHKSEFNIEEIFKNLYKKDLKESFKLLNNAENKGIPSKSVYTQIIDKLKNYLLSEEGYKDNIINNFTKGDLIKITEIFIECWNRYQNDVSEYMPLYISSAKWCMRVGSGEDTLVKKIGIDSEIDKADPENIRNSSGSEQKENRNSINGLGNNSFPENKGDNVISGDMKMSDVNGKFSDELWKQVLSIIRSHNASTEALLRASKPLSFDGRKLQLGVFYKFHKEKLESVPHRICLEDGLRGVVGTDVVVEYFLTTPEKTISNPEETKVDTSTHQNGIDNNNTKNEEVVLAETDDLDLSKLADEIFGS